jgi:uncharacterized protein YndB with AHSA1/START domain
MIASNVDDERTRVELQAELNAPREAVWPLLATADGLGRWLDHAEMDARVGGAVRLTLGDAAAVGSIVALDPPQHISFTWDWEGEPLGSRTVLALDAIEHGAATHVTLRHVGLRPGSQLEQHASMWRYWFGRLRLAVDEPRFRRAKR